MTPFTRKLRILLGLLTLTVALYNCQPKEVASLTPFTYTFKQFEAVKLPSVTATAPASVTVTDSKIVSSTATAAVSGALSTTATPAQVASVTQTAAQVTSVIPQAQATAVAAKYTSADIIKTAQSGSVPADLKAIADAFKTSPALQKFLDSFTPPVVNGKPVSGARIAGVEAIAVVMAPLDDIDACKNNANEAYNTALTDLTNQRTAQITPITAAYNQEVAKANAAATTCGTTATSKYAPLRQAATTAYNQNLAAATAFANQYSGAARDQTYYGLWALFTATYLEAMSIYNEGERLDKKACDEVKAAALANALAAQNADLAKINTNFAAKQTELQKLRDDVVASCHNQGSGK